MEHTVDETDMVEDRGWRAREAACVKTSVLKNFSSCLSNKICVFWCGETHTVVLISVHARDKAASYDVVFIGTYYIVFAPRHAIGL